ncbi:hypothetical protein ROZALSC1DRAFT_26859 [Rozella allomycis CSF55]|uniref:Transcriptional activator Spt7 domain-containing protein n=1 Tax=Rozella allomycis (strain CSF55) TaxID=988480 RepID=A0A075ATM7_ROZAC|nr:Transcriptional activator Spt7 domain-containing protein [Rozella allomycis CSF55]RKP21752.1 hypothetical protein ROZALSC1DRAFT_26859 [Rozella allomycis CSF55]|eukprot:EPZ33530.1 Transcriptional activator Spt7 domain-containing protein [Rozella allomycis CSF55]
MIHEQLIYELFPECPDKWKRMSDAKSVEEDFAIIVDDMYYTLEDDINDIENDFKKDHMEKDSNEEARKLNFRLGAETPVNDNENMIGLKYLLAEIDRNHTGKSSRELKTLLLEVRPNRSKWANEGKVGQEELYDTCEKVLAQLKLYTPHVTPFLNKVSKKDAPDYYDVIKNPMDLGTMARKLKSFEYQSKSEFASDLNLIYTNCIQYNSSPDSIYRIHATKLKEKYEELLKFVPDIEIKDRDDLEEDESESKILLTSETVVSVVDDGQFSKFPDLPDQPSIGDEDLAFEDMDNEPLNINEILDPSMPLLQDIQEIKFKSVSFEIRTNYLLNRKTLVSNRKSEFSRNMISPPLNSEFNFFPEFQFISGCIPDSLCFPYHSIRMSRENLDSFEERPRYSNFRSALPNSKALEQICSTIKSLQNIRNLCDQMELLPDNTLVPRQYSMPSYTPQFEELYQSDITNHLCKSLLELNLNCLLTFHGFEGVQTNALFLLSDIFVSLFSDLARTLKTYFEVYSKSKTLQTRKEILQLSLNATFNLKLKDIAEYICDFYVSYPATLDDLENKLSSTFDKIFHPETFDFTLNEEDFISGNFAELAGIDIFGLRDLGIDATSIPESLFNPSRKKSSKRLIDSNTPNKTFKPHHQLPSLSETTFIGLLAPIVNEKTKNNALVDEHLSHTKAIKPRPVKKSKK